MLLRLTVCAALCGICASPAPLFAQAVLVQGFNTSDPHGAFALRMPPPLRRDDEQAHPTTQALAADFAAMQPRGPLMPRKHAMSPASIFPQIRCMPVPYAPNPRLPPESERRRATWYSAMMAAACEAGVPVRLFDALITQESRYNPAAVSPKGATGLAQLMPASAAALGVRNPWDPLDNMRGGARYLRTLLDEFGRFDLALAAYNAGAGRVRATRSVPHIAETTNYVATILTTMRDQFARAEQLRGWPAPP